MSKLQRGQGVGADSSDEASLTVSNLDLDLNTDEINGTVQMLSDKLNKSETLSISEVDNVCAELQKAVVTQPGYELGDPSGVLDNGLERAVMGSEAGDVSPLRNTLQREVDGLESENEDEDANQTSDNLVAQGVVQDNTSNKSAGENFNESSMDDTAHDQMQYSGVLTVRRDISTKAACESLFDANKVKVEYDEEKISTPIQETAANTVQN